MNKRVCSSLLNPKPVLIEDIMTISQTNKYFRYVFAAVVFLFFCIYFENQSRVSIQDRNNNQFDYFKQEEFVQKTIMKSYDWEIKYRSDNLEYNLDVAGRAIENLQQQNKYLDSFIIPPHN